MRAYSEQNIGGLYTKECEHGVAAFNNSTALFAGNIKLRGNRKAATNGHDFADSIPDWRLR